MDETELVAIYPFFYSCTIFIGILVAPLGAVTVEITDDDLWFVCKGNWLREVEDLCN